MEVIKMNDLIVTYILNISKILLVVVTMSYYLGLNNKINPLKVKEKINFENRTNTFLSKFI